MFNDKQEDFTEVMLTCLPELNTWTVRWMFMEDLS